MQGLSEVNEEALKIEENNAFALAIFEPGESCMPRGFVVPSNLK